MGVQKYRFCPLGHRVVYSGLALPPCSICGQRLDRKSREYVLDDSAEDSGQPGQAVTPDTGENRAPERAAAQTPVRETPAADVPVVGTRRSVEPVQSKPETSRADAGNIPVRRRPVADISAVPEGDIPQRRPVYTEPERSRNDLGIWLELFGTAIPIPPEGGWLGRDGIGAELLEGYLLVSRNHVQVMPDRGGRLMVTDRDSTNGTWYTRDGQKQRLESGRTEILEAGDILWLYNIPLKVVTDDV